MARYYIHKDVYLNYADITYFARIKQSLSYVRTYKITAEVIIKSRKKVANIKVPRPLNKNSFIIF